MTKPEHFRIYIAGYLLLFKDNKILLLHRYNTGYQDGYYSLPAGHFDGGETAKQCVMREAKEEVGIDLNEDDLKVSYISHRMSVDREYIDIFITADKWAGELVNNEPHKHDELLWCDQNELPKNISPEVADAIDNLLKNKNKFYGEFGWDGC